MNPSQASRTALATSLMRAVHSRADPAPLLDDTWGDRLVPDTVRAAFRQRALERLGPAAATLPPDAVLDAAMRANAAYADVILRSRYTEDALKDAVARGIAQYVLIGAGFDSFVCRVPAWAHRLDIYEVDHPATQQLKRQCLAACGVPPSASVHFVEADLSTESLGAALARSSFDAARPTFFSWLGVTVYLTREANLAALRDITSCTAHTAPGSELVFTYIDEAALRPGSEGAEAFQKLRSDVAAVGEEFLSGFDPQALPALLRGTGLDLLEDLDGHAALARYDPVGRNGLRPAGAAHIAHARVVSAAASPAA
ncbi:class I SAM-dependent methyltransferase [Acidovorax cavernicola]|uniref:S-adenosyl-L-methionine-dependent methyltransferase n=1 Tax=Acidovorax cavernicola TaxID=1675792 RepID=A0A9X8D3H2_9BURK|nr:SAM-dependent methyltransferase [Acidovorax cavernicola]RIX77978.1 class I SAM-dependent methyltransferase [Acidovorax cavernicola]